MKLEDREIPDLHELAVFEWRGWPLVVRCLHRIYGAYVRLLAFSIRLAGRLAR